MARHLLIALVLALGTTAGCLRQRFDLCDDEEPHPDCALVDAGRADAGDASADAGGDASP